MGNTVDKIVKGSIETASVFGSMDSAPRVSVDGVYVINLDSATDRWRRVVRQLARVGLTPTRVPAVDLRKDATQAESLLSPEAREQLAYFQRHKMRQRNSDLGSPGTVGCFMSHLKAYQMALDDGCRNALIMEDDFILDPIRFLQLPRYLKRVPLDFDIFNLGVCNRDAPKMRSEPESRGVVPVHHFYFLHAYIVSQKGAQNLLRLLNPIRKQIDSQISDLNEQGLIKTYCTGRMLVTQGGFVTSIQTAVADPTSEFQMPLKFGYERQVREVPTSQVGIPFLGHAFPPTEEPEQTRPTPIVKPPKSKTKTRIAFETPETYEELAQRSTGRSTERFTES